MNGADEISQRDKCNVTENKNRPNSTYITKLY